MRDLLLHLPQPLLILLIVGGSALIAVGATYFVRTRINEKEHLANNEVAGFIFAAIAAVYGVLLAFLVLVVWQTFETSQVTVENEANHLVNIYRLGQGLSEPYGSRVRQQSLAYAKGVRDDEWKTMEEGKSSPQVSAALDELWRIHRELDASDNRSNNHEQQFFDTLNELGNTRRLRLLQSRLELPALLWGLLIVGALITIGFTLFLRAPNWKAHLLMAGMFAGLVAFVLLLVVELDNPFAGAVHVEPFAFEQAIDLFVELDRN